MSNINDFYSKLKNKEKVFNSEVNYVLKNDTNSFTIKRHGIEIESLNSSGVNITDVRLVFDEDLLTVTTGVIYEQDDSLIENLEFTEETKKITNIKREEDTENTKLDVTLLNLDNTGISGNNIIYSREGNIFGINVTDNTLSYNSNQTIEYNSPENPSIYTLKITTSDFKETSGKDIFHFTDTDENKTVYFREVEDNANVGFEYDSSKSGTIVKFQKIIETRG